MNYFKSAVAFFFLLFLNGISFGTRQQGISYNVLRLGEDCLTDAQFSHKTFWQLLPNRCYVLGGLSALSLI